MAGRRRLAGAGPALKSRRLGCRAAAAVKEAEPAVDNADTLVASCAKTQPIGLRGLAVIELEHAAEPRTAHDGPVPIDVVLSAMSSLPRPWCGTPGRTSGFTPLPRSRRRKAAVYNG